MAKVLRPPPSMVADSALGPFDFPPDAAVRAGSSSGPAGQGKVTEGNGLPILPQLTQKRHIAQSNRCLAGLPDRFLDVDASRCGLTQIFYVCMS